jgi:hypothetical protein
MADTLTHKERKVLDLLIKYANGINRPIHYRALREAGFPEELALVLKSKVEYLDSLANREFQVLRNKGWITMDEGINTVIAVP